MDFTDVTLTTQLTDGKTSTSGLFIIDVEAKKIEITCKDTGKQTSFSMVDLCLPSIRPTQGKMCLNRAQGSSLADNLVHIGIEGSCTADTDTIFEVFLNLKWGAERKPEVSVDASIAALKTLGKCQRCGQRYGSIVKVLRAHACNLVDYRLRPYIGQCGHVCCGICAGDAHCVDGGKEKDKKPTMCTVCPTSMKTDWTFCQSFSDVIDKLVDITTILERSKDNEKAQADAVRIQNELKTAMEKAQEDLINARNEKDEKCRQLVKQKGEMEKELLKAQEILRNARKEMDERQRVLTLEREDMKRQTNEKRDELEKKIEKLENSLSREKKKIKIKILTKNTEDASGARDECAHCKVIEKTERMHVCIGCAGNGTVLEGGEKKKIAPFILCANCFVNDHQGHTRVKYVDMVRGLVTSEVEETEKFLESIDKPFLDVLSKRPTVADWLKNTANKKTLKFEEITFREAFETRKDLALERETVKKAVENTLAEFDKGLKAFEDIQKQVADKANRKRKAT